LTAELIGWHDEHTPDHRRRLRNAMLVSIAIHGSIFAAFAISPPRPIAPMPQVLTVELVTGPPSGARASRPKPAPPAPRPKAPEAPPPPPPPPAPPLAKAPVQVLPEESPGRIRKVEPEAPPPKKIVKAEPKPAPPRPKREEELSYDAAMAELGLDETEEFLEALPGARKEEETSSGSPEAATGSEQPSAGAAISPELARWNHATQRRIQRKWVTPPNLRNRGLATTLEVRLTLAGELIGPPKVAGTSGDPYFDDNAVRAVLSAAPLPPPPKAGRRIFLFRSEGN
jgi:outer membrane biosynthesis protein TonB